jgi:uncharacterized membrane protein
VGICQNQRPDLSGGILENESGATMAYLLAVAVGVVAGSRTMMAPAAVAWAAGLGRLELAGTWLAFFESVWARGVLTVLACVELVTDQLPTTPSRTVPVQFGARLLTGGLSGAAIGAAKATLVGGLIAGLIGAVIGTFGGRALRGWLAKAFGNDHPAGFVEDALALGGAALIVWALK